MAHFFRLNEERAGIPPHDVGIRPRFAHLDGCRTLMTLWVCLEHYHQADEFMALGGARFLLNRANVPVDYYVILSGFITAHAYAERDFGGERERTIFYIKRFGRVALS